MIPPTPKMKCLNEWNLEIRNLKVFQIDKQLTNVFEFVEQTNDEANLQAQIETEKYEREWLDKASVKKKDEVISAV